MSRRFLKSAHYSVHQLVINAPELSFQTRHDYKKGLKLAVTQLHEMGSQISNIRDLKVKHVKKLAAHWKGQGLQAGTIKNRMSQLRYVFNRVKKPQLIPK